MWCYHRIDLLRVLPIWTLDNQEIAGTGNKRLWLAQSVGGDYNILWNLETPQAGVIEFIHIIVDAYGCNHPDCYAYRWPGYRNGHAQWRA